MELIHLMILRGDTEQKLQYTNDGVYNYAQVLCHYGALILEFRDAVSEGDGEHVYRCWRVMLPHFLASRHTKYSYDCSFRLRHSFLRT